MKTTLGTVVCQAGSIFCVAGIIWFALMTLSLPGALFVIGGVLLMVGVIYDVINS